MRWTTAAIILLALAAGCTNNNKKTDERNALSPGVTDIAPAPAPTAFTPPPQQPAQPVVDNTQQASAPAAAANQKYTVRRGDTLWKIAQSHYGNGNQWQRIVSANPGLSAEKLKAGQTITIP